MSFIGASVKGVVAGRAGSGPGAERGDFALTSLPSGAWGRMVSAGGWEEAVGGAADSTTSALDTVGSLSRIGAMAGTAGLPWALSVGLPVLGVWGSVGVSTGTALVASVVVLLGTTSWAAFLVLGVASSLLDALGADSGVLPVAGNGGSLMTSVSLGGAGALGFKNLAGTPVAASEPPPTQAPSKLLHL